MDATGYPAAFGRSFSPASKYEVWFHNCNLVGHKHVPVSWYGQNPIQVFAIFKLQRLRDFVQLLIPFNYKILPVLVHNKFDVQVM